MNEFPCTGLTDCDPASHPQMWDIYKRNSDGWLFMEPRMVESHKETFVFIHGLDGSAMWSLEKMLPWHVKLFVPSSTRVILPQSPHDDDYKMNSWFKMTVQRDYSTKESFYESINQK